MVRISLDQKGYTGHILLQPNLSLSWKTNKTIIKVIGLISACIAAYFSYFGFWLVSPFSGLAVVCFAVAIYIFFRRNNRRQVVTFTDDKVLIEMGRSTPERSYEYARHWSKFYVSGNAKRDIPRVCIKSHGRELELGPFLGHDEKLQLIETLKNITTAFQHSQAFQPRHQ